MMKPIRLILVMCGMWGGGMSIVQAAMEPYLARSTRHQFFVYAASQAQADRVVMRAESNADRLNEFYSRKIPRFQIPIVMGLGTLQEMPTEGEGRLRLIPTSNGCKLQIQWASSIIPGAYFDRSLGRALAARIILEQIDWRNPKIQYPDLPNWVLEGTGVPSMEEETRVQIRNRASLLARVDAELSLQEVLRVSQEPHPEQPITQIFSWALCAPFLAQEQRRSEWPRLISQGGDSQSILQRLVGKVPLESWWNTVWNEQARNQTLLHLGYGVSENWVLNMEKRWQTDGWGTSNNWNDSRGIDTALHPWFGSWMQQLVKVKNSGDWAPLLLTRRDLQRRRDAALEWFTSHEQDSTAINWTDWELRWRSFQTPQLKGDMEKWFEDVLSQVPP